MDQLSRAQPHNAEEPSTSPMAREPDESTPGLDTPISKTDGAVARKPLPNPPKYDGLRKSYTAWARQMRDKLELDAHYFNGNRELWYLINSCLGEKPQQVVATFYAAGGPGGAYDPQEFMRYLDRTYQDSNIQSRAAATLRTMRQREDQTLASFLPRFEQALAEAGGADWPDNAKIVFLENAINKRLQESLVTAVLPEDYQGWLTRLQEIAGRLERLSPGRQSPSKEQSPSDLQKERLKGRLEDSDGDTPMTDVNRAVRQSKGRRDLGLKHKDKRRCFRCERTDHVIADCPAKVVFPDEVKKSRPATARVKQPDTSDDSDSSATSSGDEESTGKEGNPIRVLVDSGCDCYAVIDEAVVQKFRIPLVDSKPRQIGGFSESSESVTSPGVVAVVVETAGFDERIFAYVVPSLGQDMFLGRPWMERNQVVYDAAKRQVYHGRAGVTVRLVGQEEPAKVRAIRSARLVSAAVFTAECRRAKRRQKMLRVST
ncbi:hypothetical protein HIM_11109 [Hirsutella minnesotensis 3608]|uniref:CCHC-type domain-containing protein n=1 Tax=Hirsutella minnesotensis 3608 TaxID=1043627 RepID=A0A0F7ZWS7_9HYPO|nr:hypothetical protein HIM_11109 [Hirsutella minnesotensis 3608]